MVDLPLIVTIRLPEEEVLASAKERAAFLLQGATGVSAVVLLCAAALTLQMVRQFRIGLMLASTNCQIRAHEQELGQRVAERTAALERSHQHVYELAYHDPLTGLPNRVLFADLAMHSVQRAQRNGFKFALVVVDLDRFRMINDTLGHHAGDELLRAAGERIRRAIRSSDTVARLGNDEFVIVAEELDDAGQVIHITNLIRQELSDPLCLDGQTLHISASIGTAVFPDDGGDLGTLIKNADLAMTVAKAAGGDTVCSFEPAMTQAAEQRLVIEHALRSALKGGQFTLVYQPKVCVVTGQLRGVEALVRLQHPDGRYIPPADFIPLAEETGLIEPLGAWVIEEACRVMGAWDAKRLGPLSIAVNVAAAQINRGDLTALVSRLTRLHRIDPGQLEIEITETAVIGDTDRALATLNQLRSLGVSVALDDFGTGYSSLVYLRRLDIDTIKIDRSFIGNAQPDTRDAEIARQMIRLAKTLQLSVVAEGVKTEEQVAFLREAGCDVMQGYLIARPMSLDKLKVWIAERYTTARHPSQGTKAAVFADHAFDTAADERDCRR